MASKMSNDVLKLTQEIENLKVLLAKERKNNADVISSIRSEVEKQAKSNAKIFDAVLGLEEEKANLRKAVHKLKLRNEMLTRKVNKIKERVKNTQASIDDLASEDEFDLIDYDDIGRNFIVIGGKNDPLAFGYSAKFKDENGLEHQSAERYFWFLMANHFDDKSTAEAIRCAESYQKAEELKNSIVGYDEQSWNNVKLDLYVKAQQRKFLQLRILRNTLILTGQTYLAVSLDDKFFGTGWRKQREEACKPLTWDGENNGGKVLMQLRKTYTKTHNWLSDEEKTEAEIRFRELKHFAWRRFPTYEKEKSSNGGFKNSVSGKWRRGQSRA